MKPTTSAQRQVEELVVEGMSRAKAEEVVARRIEASIAGEETADYDPGELFGVVVEDGDPAATLDAHHAHDDPELRAELGGL